jgi:hypothetical protein
MKKLGDLYWAQLSMWNFSKKENVDAFSKDGFHYELQITTGEQVDNRWKAKNLTWKELTDFEIDLITLMPEGRIMGYKIVGNISDNKLTGERL